MPFRNLEGKVFVLGVGAQKAGTTWLTDYLHHHGAFVMSPIKELHFFDQKLRPDLCADFGRLFEIMLRNAIAKLGSGSDPAALIEMSHLLDRVRMNNDDRAYFEYFDRLATIDRSHVGEITPSYSLIRADGFRQIRSLFERQNIRLKLIFLMRDPVRRLLSQLSMDSRERGTPNDADAYRRALYDARYVERTRYDLTLEALDAAFDSDQVYAAFYERLFDQAAIDGLCRFLEVPPQPADFGRGVNVGDPPLSLSADAYAMGVECFRSVYDFCRARYGDGVPETWGRPDVPHG